MTYRPRASCRRCGATRPAVGHLSRRGNCLACGITAEADNITQMRAKAGPYYEAWRDAIIEWVACLPGAIVIPGTVPDSIVAEKRSAQQVQFTGR